MSSSVQATHSSPSSSNAAAATTEQPSWEVLLLVSHFLDPKTLAIASCVCKPWSMCMAQDHLWKPICLSGFPSISHLRHFDPTISYQRLYALGRLASKHRRPIPVAPHLSLHDLIFVIDVFTENGRVFSVAKFGAELNTCASGVWEFDVQVWDGDYGGWIEEEEKEGVKVVWTVALKEWKAAFFMMEGKGNGKMVGGNGMWFSDELPSPRCYSTAVKSGLVAEVGLGFSGYGDDGEKRARVEKVSLGLMSVMGWRYVSVDDGLRYLQHFLLPSIA